MTIDEVETHPVQLHTKAFCHKRDNRCPKAVTMRAYEVYCERFGAQEKMVTGTCRGGFGVGELIAMLYARTFPKEEWSKRMDEALKGMDI